MGKSIRTTVIGGIIFVVPLIFILLILGRAFDLAKRVATPISKFVPIESFAGIAAANVLAGFIVISVCYVAGVLARSSMISDKVGKLDAFLGRAIPTYQPTKQGFVDSISNRSFEDDWKVVLVGTKGDRRFLGFEVERLQNGEVSVFQPLSPNTKSGFVWTVPSAQVEVLHMNPRELSAILRSHGIGLSESPVQASG